MKSVICNLHEMLTLSGSSRLISSSPLFTITCILEQWSTSFDFLSRRRVGFNWISLISLLDFPFCICICCLNNLYFHAWFQLHFLSPALEWKKILISFNLLTFTHFSFHTFCCFPFAGHVCGCCIMCFTLCLVGRIVCCSWWIAMLPKIVTYALLPNILYSDRTQPK